MDTPKPSGFIEVILRRRQRGRPSRRQVLRVRIPEGVILEIGDRVPAGLVLAVFKAVRRRWPC
jgi:hypothetical protein